MALLQEGDTIDYSVLKEQDNDVIQMTGLKQKRDKRRILRWGIAVGMGILAIFSLILLVQFCFQTS